MTAVVLDHDWYDEPLPSNVVLGERSWVHSTYAFLHFRSDRRPGLRLGDDSGLYIGTMLELGPQGSVEVGRFCAIGGALFRTNSRIRVGDHALVSWDVLFSTAGTDWPVPPGCESEHADEPEMHVGDNVWVGARALLLGGITVGDDAVIGAGAVVRDSVPAGAIVAGNPATMVGAVPGHTVGGG